MKIVINYPHLYTLPGTVGDPYKLIISMTLFPSSTNKEVKERRKKWKTSPRKQTSCVSGVLLVGL